MSATEPQRRSPLTSLRSFVRERKPVERCELCGTVIAEEHSHLWETSARQIVCACDACAILFSGRQNARYLRVPRSIEVLENFRLPDELWEELNLPIHLAFFVPGNPVRAFYPSPAGATESFPRAEAWQTLIAENPVLSDLEPDVEALLVNRLGHARESYRVPIDECYKLVGLIRTRWRGLSGGTEVWEEIGRFFLGLKERAGPWEGGARA
jgi:hypothetical protein